MNRNKIILKNCPNFYKIINFDYPEGDNISERLITIFQEYIFSVDINDTDELKKITELDKVLNKYIDDYLFRKEMRYGLLQLRFKKDDDLLRAITEQILRLFSNYEEGLTRNIYFSRWI